MQTWIDYTNRDYESLVTSMKALAREKVPEWTDHSPNDLGILLLELFAHMGDIILYYQDRIANESFLSTAQERKSILYLLRLIGYELLPATSASAELTLKFKKPDVAPDESAVVVIKPGTQFATKKTDVAEAAYFEYIGPGEISIDLSEDSSNEDLVVYKGLPVRHSESKTDDPLGSSTGEPNQAFRLKSKPLIRESLAIYVLEGEDWVRWERREHLLYHIAEAPQEEFGANHIYRFNEIDLSGPEDRHYYVQTDENDDAWVIFGDGGNGRIPPAGSDNIRAEYRVGGGSVGNVSANKITEIITDVDQLEEVCNPYPAVGGVDQESIEHARRFAPLRFRSGDRTVTLNDFISLAHTFGGVAKAYAECSGWNTVILYVAPEADADEPAPLDLQPSSDLRQRLISYFRHKKMVGTEVCIRPPKIVPIEIEVEVTAGFNYFKVDVKREVEKAVKGLLAYGQVSFAANVYLSKVYEALEAIPSVAYANVRVFRRQARGFYSKTGILADLRDPIGRYKQPLIELAIRVEADGRIEMGPSEIPTLGRFQIDIQGGIEAGSS